MKDKGIKKIRAYFQKIPAVVLVYVYGSQAKRQARKDSDIDIAILVDENKADYFKIRLKAMVYLPSILKRDVDVKDLNSSPTTFSYRVISEGIVIYEKNRKKRVDFETRLMRDYFDMRPFLEEYSKQIASLARSGKISARPFSY